MSAPWSIQLLGTLAARRADRVVDRFRTHKTAALLAYLAHHPDRAHPREALIDLLWPDCEPDAGRNSLSQALSALRGQLEPPGTGAGSVIVATRASVRLAPGSFDTDVRALEAAMAARDFERALALYKGPFLPGHYHEWTQAERERLEAQHQETLRALGVRREEAGDVAGALDLARRAVAADPLCEPAWRDLIGRTAAAGEPLRALRLAKDLERALEREMGAEPSPATRTLVRSIEKRAREVSGRAAVAAARAAGGGGAPPPAPRAAAPRALPSGTVTFLLAEGPAAAAIAALVERHEGRALEKVAVAASPGGAPPPTTPAPPLAARAPTPARGMPAVGAPAVTPLPAPLTAAGPALAAAFARPSDALACVLAALRLAPGPSLRAAVDTGEVALEEGRYRGAVLEHAARLLGAARPSQVLLAEETAALVRRDLDPALRLSDLGLWRLSESAPSERLFSVRLATGRSGRISAVLRGGAPAPGPGGADLASAPATASGTFSAAALAAAQAAAAGSEGREPEEPTPDALPGRGAPLPLEAGRIIGRDEELSRVCEALLGERARLVTVSGPGGIGKTRLALEAARRLGERLAGAGGVVFVPLADLDDARLLPSALHAALRLPSSGARDALAAVVEALLRERRLLVLDGLDQAGPGAASLVADLLARVPSLAVLATARARLGVAGERELPLGPLAAPDVLESPAALLAVPSVRLFVDRAREARPDFALGARNAAAVAELCRRLAGIPLAIAIAASRAHALSPEELLLRSGERHDAAAASGRDADTRRLTLRAAIEWNHRALAPELQRFFARLSIFRGGFTLAAAETVCEEPLALDRTAELRECALLLAEESAAGGLRFRVLESLREFGHAELAPEERASLARRHAAFFLEEAERAAPAFLGADQARVLDRLAADHDNFRAAMAATLAAGPSTPDALRASYAQGERGDDTALRLATALFRFWLVRGHFALGRRLLEQALARSPARTAARAYALRAAGGLAQGESVLPEARAHLEESLSIFREVADREGVGRAANDLGNVLRVLGEPVLARAALEESLAIARERGEPKAIAPVLNNLGTLAWSQGDLPAARALLEEAVALERALGNERNTAISLRNLGLVREGPADAPRAARALDEALAILRRLGDDRSVGLTLVSRGSIASEAKDPAAARAAFEEALAIGRRLGTTPIEAYARLNLGMLALEADDRPRARADLAAALARFHDLGLKESLAIALEHLASLDAREGSARRAARLLGAAAAILETAGARRTEREQSALEARRAPVRATLGDADYAEAFADGHALAMADAVKEALARSLVI